MISDQENEIYTQIGPTKQLGLVLFNRINTFLLKLFCSYFSTILYY